MELLMIFDIGYLKIFYSAFYLELDDKIEHNPWRQFFLIANYFIYLLSLKIDQALSCSY